MARKSRPCTQCVLGPLLQVELSTQNRNVRESPKVKGLRSKLSGKEKPRPCKPKPSGFMR